MKLVFDKDAWTDYVYWQTQDRAVLKRINTILRDIERGSAEDEPNVGLGKPEPLKHGFSGYWSRRITDEHWLIYRVCCTDR